MFKVYDNVWIMENNVPKQKLVFAVVECMDYFKTGIEKHYQLVDSKAGAGWGNIEGVRRNEVEVFISLEDLLSSMGEKAVKA